MELEVTDSLAKTMPHLEQLREFASERKFAFNSDQYYEVPVVTMSWRSPDRMNRLKAFARVTGLIEVVANQSNLTPIIKTAKRKTYGWEVYELDAADWEGLKALLERLVDHLNEGRLPDGGPRVV